MSPRDGSGTTIGRFGLGFKSVYTVTDLPEIHSGDEDFAIENYVFPKRMARSARAADETQIVLPLKTMLPLSSSRLACSARRTTNRLAIENEILGC